MEEDKKDDKCFFQIFKNQNPELLSIHMRRFASDPRLASTLIFNINKDDLKNIISEILANYQCFDKESCDEVVYHSYRRFGLGFKNDSSIR